jgi:Ca2+-binding EF-hand superfamily protein
MRRGTKDSSLYSKLVDPVILTKYPLPNEMISDLQDAFSYYDPEDSGHISQAHFKNILHNFGYHAKIKKEMDDEIRKVDSEINKRQFIDISVVQACVGIRWAREFKEEESRECFRLFDKRERNFITLNELKQVLPNHLPFPVSEADIQEFMNECNGHTQEAS